MKMKSLLEKQVTEACKQLFDVEIKIELTRPEEQFGDYTTNLALILSKQLSKNPREIAEIIATKLRENISEYIDSVTIAGPGFINFHLSDKALNDALKKKPEKRLADKVIVAEYSDPNPFKVLHAGHLYTTITGDAIARLLEVAGAKVHRLNYGGDVGLHVGKSMWAIIQTLGGELPDKLEAIDAAKRPEWLSDRYVEGNSAYEQDEKSKAEIVQNNKLVYELHAKNDHESPFAQIYWTCRAWSYDGFGALYDQLQVTQFERYIAESEVTPLGIELVEKGLADGTFTKSDGAVVFAGEEHGLHTRVFLNSNGLPTYEAKELGLAALKWQDFQFDQGIIITANDIVEYMKVVLKALENFYPDIVSRSRHFTHGVIKLPGGEKMSSRKGNIVRAQDILDAADRANQTLNGQNNHETVLGAVKYALLKNRIGGDIIYDPEQSVSLEGNSGPYLQYSHARARSILSKATLADVNTEPFVDDIAFEPEERSLVRKITEYIEVFDKAVVELMPHHICTYLYELAQVFNHFYEHNRVIGDKREVVRLMLVKQYADTLQTGLGLLGIAAPDRM
jgi:arginyl-tRNA synthetase